MTFTAPAALLLLLLLIPVIALGWPRIAYRRGRDTASLVLRTIIVTLVVLALAGAQAVHGTDRLAVVFLVDASDSVGQEARAAQIDYIRDALNAMRPDDQAAVVVFGANALVERPMSSLRELAPLRSTPITSNTDLEEAIGLGLALFPADTAKRMVILSDGEQTIGDAERAARRAAATGVEISYVLIEREPSPEVQVTDVRVPPSVGAGQAFDLSLTVQAESDAPAEITVLADGAILHTEQITLRAGANHYALALQAGDAGFTDFRVQITPQGADRYYQNNGLSAFSRVTGPPRVLLVTPDEDEGRYLFDALTELGMAVDRAEPDDLPLGVAALQDYSAVMLANVPATALPTRRMEILQTYVRDLGGGLVVVGGPESYGPGGYFQTPLEEALPLESQIRDQQRIPQLTIVYVIDRSGSMREVGPSGVENIELAKEAIIRSIDFLQPTDRAGVVSFDTQGYWIAPVQPVLDRFGLQNLVGTLRASGGTDILAGMRTAAEALAGDPSPRKHIILLTDGGANETGLVALTRALNEDAGVTTSVIAIGRGTADFLEAMAAVGGGNYHAVQVVETIPTIFTQETVLATRSYILEEEFVPRLSGSSPILNGISAAPSLLGYVATTPRATASVVLRGPDPFNDPILAQWQYGLGRVVAFTSDATARWAANWVAWENFAQFWSQAVRWTITEGASDLLETRVVMEGEQARVIVDARERADAAGESGGFLNGLALSASIVDPALGSQTIPLPQVAPGRYEGTFIPSDEGAYFIAVSGTEAAGAPVNQTTGWVMTYSPEYASGLTRSDLLADLAALTGGQSLAEDPAQVFAHTLAAEASLNPLAPLLLLIAALLLPFDIAVRRLLITASDFARARDALFGRRLAAGGTSARISTLMDAKARAQKRTAAEPSSAPTSVPAGALRRVREERAASEAPPQPAPPPAPKPTAPRPSAPAAESAGTERQNLAGELLKKRKQRE